MKRFFTLFVLLIVLTLSSSAQMCDKNDYQYFFGWLPMLAGSATPDKVDIFAQPSLINYGWIQNGGTVPTAAENVEVSKFKHGDQTIYVWKFAKPTAIPLPYYTAFIPSGDNYVTVQLELSLDDDWVLGKSIEYGSHSNYGNVECPEDAEGFFKLIEAKKLLK